MLAIFWLYLQNVYSLTSFYFKLSCLMFWVSFFCRGHHCFLKMHVFLAVLGHYCAQAFSLCGEWGVLSSFGAQACALESTFSKTLSKCFKEHSIHWAKIYRYLNNWSQIYDSKKKKKSPSGVCHQKTLAHSALPQKMCLLAFSACEVGWFKNKSKFCKQFY